MTQIFPFLARSQAKMPKQMRSYDESAKSKKTVSSMIERKGGEKDVPPKKSVKIVEAKKEEYVPEENGADDLIAANRKKLAEKMSSKGKKADIK